MTTPPLDLPALRARIERAKERPVPPGLAGILALDALALLDRVEYESAGFEAATQDRNLWRARAEAAERDLAAVTVSRDGWQPRAEAAERSVAAVRNIHRPAKFEDSDLRYCVYCDRDDRPAYYPCPTITALDNHTPETETTP